MIWCGKARIWYHGECICAFSLHSGPSRFLQFWPNAHRSQLTAQSHRWYCYSQNRFERCVGTYVFVWNLHFNYLSLSLPCCTFLSWNFANKPSTFLLISIILRRLVTMQFFASGAHNDGKSSGLELIKSDEISAVCDEMTNTNTVEKKSESNANLCV